MLPRTLSTRIALPAGFFALVSVVALSYLLIRTQRDNALAEAAAGSESIAETVLRTIEHEMRVNERDAIREIVAAVGGQSGVESIRIFNKDGRISFSSRPDDVGGMVDMQAEECVQCHSGPTPERALDPEDRSRIFRDAAGRQIMGTMRVINNKEGCQGAGCHASPAAQSVLGVLDVDVSLEPARARLARASLNAFLLSLAAVTLITGLLFWIIWRSVQRPLTTVITATRRVAGGGGGVRAPPGSAREIQILATSLNEAVESLSSSRSQLEQWAESLEETVAEKALQLQDARFQVAQAEKLSSVGMVAAGIAHELNSPLMAILTFTHLVKNAVPEDDPAQQDLKMIERETNRCAAIIRQLLDFARKQTQDAATEPCRMDAVVHEALELLKVELQNAEVEAHVSVPEDLPTVEANPVQLMQVFVNLFLNAIHAMPEGGDLYVEADAVGRWEYAQVDLPPHPSTHLVRTVVRDTGTGIPPDQISKIFDPFFTTKPVGKGSGLGLAVSLGLIGSYRGTILAASDGSTGAAFTILLPAQPSSERA